MSWFSDATDLRIAQWKALPLWVRAYSFAIGLPAWLYLAYRLLTSPNPLALSTADEVALVLFVSACLVSGAALLRAFWRMDV